MSVSSRSVAQKCCSDVSLRNLVRSVDQKCCSDQKCGSDVLLRSVNQKCGSQVSFKSVSEVSVESVAQKCRAEGSNRTVSRSFDQECAPKVLLRGVAPCSEASRRCVAHVADLLV